MHGCSKDRKFEWITVPQSPYNKQSAKCKRQNTFVLILTPTLASVVIVSHHDSRIKMWILRRRLEKTFTVFLNQEAQLQKPEYFCQDKTKSNKKRKKHPALLQSLIIRSCWAIFSLLYMQRVCSVRIVCRSWCYIRKYEKKEFAGSLMPHCWTRCQAATSRFKKY